MKFIARLKQGATPADAIRLVSPNPLGVVPTGLERYAVIEASDLEEVLRRPDVVMAYVAPRYMLPIAPDEDPDPATRPAIPAFPGGSVSPYLVSEQFYLKEFKTNRVGAIPGGKGTGIKVIDIEFGWNFNHEDNYFRLGALMGGTNASFQDHGTAVMGLVAGDENDFGITGIAPEALFYGWGISGAPIEQAVVGAADKLSPGDVLMLELQVSGPNTNPNRPGQAGYIPPEYFPAMFEAVSYATSKGIVVVEAGGNGNENLDDPVYDGVFDRSVRDSGAIIVGACEAGILHRVPAGFTNYGSRMDVFGYGRRVVTSGYGDAFFTEDQNKYYTTQFSGTSSATPMITGVCAAINGIRKARGAKPFSSVEMREFIVHNGYPADHQSGNPDGAIAKEIGVLPNLFYLAKIASGFPDYNDDDKVDFTDFLAFNNYYAGDDRFADLDIDGEVGFGDFMAFREKFGTQWR